MMTALLWFALVSYGMFALYGVFIWIGDMRDSRRRERRRRKAHYARMRS